MIFIDQPEQFYTINIIPGFLYKNISVTLIIGCSLALVILIYLIFIKKSKGKKISNNIILILFLISWIPLYINFFYNNLYDFHENRSISEYDVEKKRVVRMCNIDNRGGYSGLVCQMFSFLRYSESIVPEKSLVKIISADPLLSTYLNYYTIPYFNTTDSFEDADYVLYYFDREHEYKDGSLIVSSLGESIGNYELIGNIGPMKLILKK